MAMNKQRRTSNINNIVSYDASGNVTLPAQLSIPGQLKLTGYLTTSSFPGTVVGYLAFDASGNILSASVPTILNGTGFVRTAGTAISYITGTSAQFVMADGSLNSSVYSLSSHIHDDRYFTETETDDLIVPGLRAGMNITGGGTISVDASGNINWTNRLIVICNGRSATSAVSGFFDINVPTAGTVITGVGGASNKTVGATGIPLAAWEALYYILPFGSSNASVAANFRVVSYTANVTVPYNWLLLCVRNGDSPGVFRFTNGVTLLLNDSSAGYETNSNVGNTLVSRDGSGNFSAGTITATLNGNAATATSATSATNATNASFATTQAIGDYSTAIANTIFVKNLFGATTTSGTLDWNDVSNTQPGSSATLLLGNATNGFGLAGSYYHPFNLEYSSKNGTGNVTQLAIAYGLPGNDIKMRGRYQGSWTSWITFLNSGNYNSYSPTLSGVGATGTWGINVTGTAASETLATVTGRGNTTTTSIGANNFWDVNVGSYNVNLGSAGNEGRGVVAGYSGSSYSGIGYNVRHTTTGGSWIAPGTDTSSYLVFGNGGFTFYGAPSGTAGRTLNYTTLGSFDAVGNFNAFNVTVNGNQTLHAANWNSYAPSLTGTGASGTWAINVTGSAYSATDALRIVFNDGPRDLTNRTPTTLARSVNFDFVGASFVGGTGNYAGVMSFTPWTGTTVSTGDSSYQLAFINESGQDGAGLPGLRLRKGIDSTWGTWYNLLHAGNYNSYSPTLTGTGASGTWGISISGNAATATSLSSSNFISRGGTSGNYNTDFSNTAAGTYRYLGDDASISNSPGGSWWFVENFRHYNSSALWGTQVAWGWEDNANRLATRNVQNGTFGNWVYYLNSSNYTAYAPSLTGSGASGTWAISISGNAATVGGIDVSRIVYGDGARGKSTAKTNDTANGLDSTNPSGFYFGSGVTGMPTTDWWNWINVAGNAWTGPGDGYGFQLAHSFWGDDLKIRRVQSGTWYPWVQVWTSGNMNAPNSVFNASNYYDVNTWFAMNGTHGMYWPNYYGAHFQVNTTSTYGQFQILGNKAGYDGIYSGYSGVNGIMFDANGSGGAYKESIGKWYWYYNAVNDCVAIGGATTSSSYKVYLNGATYVAGAIVASGDITAFSDKRVKENIETVQDAVSIVSKLRGVTYNRTDVEDKSRKVGVIAQEVLEVLPEVVNQGDDGMYGVSYGNIVGVLIEAIKEQQAKIDNLQEQINYLGENR
jgi:hypothetical protein